MTVPTGITVPGPTTTGAAVVAVGAGEGVDDEVDEVPDVEFEVGEGLGVGVGVGVSSSTGVPQEGLVTLLLSMVTAPFCARSLPSTVASVFAVIEATARMLPWKSVPVPRVAELPICQYTLQDTPFTKVTLLLEAVVRVEPIWKMKTESGLP